MLKAQHLILCSRPLVAAALLLQEFLFCRQLRLLGLLFFIHRPFEQFVFVHFIGYKFPVKIFDIGNKTCTFRLLHRFFFFSDCRQLFRQGVVALLFLELFIKAAIPFFRFVKAIQFFLMLFVQRFVLNFVIRDFRFIESCFQLECRKDLVDIALLSPQHFEQFGIPLRKRRFDAAQMAVQYLFFQSIGIFCRVALLFQPFADHFIRFCLEDPAQNFFFIIRFRRQ